MPQSGCSQLAKAIKELTKLPDDQRADAIQKMSSAFQCVECTQSTSFDNIIAGGSVEIGDINQIMSCGIGNSGSTEMIEQLKKFIDESETKLNTNVNKKIDISDKKTNDKILRHQIEMRNEIKKFTQIGGIVICIIFTLIIILIIMKIIGI
jgi:hypothetical protein